MPVRRYVALTGSLGRPVTTAITLRFDAEMFDAPGAAGMTGPVVQYERFDIPRRLFLMTTRMKGMPVAVLHDFDRHQASMRVRIAGLVNIVDISGPEVTRAESGRCSASGGCEHCRNSPPSTPQFKTISTKSASSTADRISNSTAPSLSPSGAGSAREARAAVGLPVNLGEGADVTSALQHFGR